MDTDKSIRAALDAEIDRLEQARALLDPHISRARRVASVSSKPAARYKALRKKDQMLPMELNIRSNYKLGGCRIWPLEPN